MADISITAANVIAGANARTKLVTAAETVTAGKVAYLVSATGRYGLADSNGASAEMKVPAGIFLGGAAAGQPVVIQEAGDITIGGTLTAGVVYYLSETPGGIQPIADVGSGENVASLGISKSTTVLALNIQNSGVTL